MQILYVFEKLRNPVLDRLMMGITIFGDATVFLLLALIVYWCVDKKQGYYLMTVGFIGTVLNQFVKITCHVPRPWVKDPNFTIVEAARESAGDYSFPSGHSQSSAGLFGGMAVEAKKRVYRLLWIAIAVLVPVSRLYLGVHTLQDVTVGSGMALILVFLLRPVARGEKMWVMTVLMPSLCAAFLLYLLIVPLHVEEAFYLSARKNAAELLGAVIGVILSYYCDRKTLNFSEKAPIKAQILKVALGFALILSLRKLCKAVLPVLFSGHWSQKILENALLVFIAGFVWPWIFTAVQKAKEK